MNQSPDDIVNKGIDRFDDIFHQYEEDLDEDQDKYVDFDNLHTLTGEDNDEEEHEIYGFEYHENPYVTKKQTQQFPMVKEEPIEEHLSQKLSQLSATDNEGKSTTSKKRPTLTPTTESVAIVSQSVTKKFKTSEQDLKIFDIMANYLSSANGRFDKVIQPLLKYVNDAPSLEELRHFANIIHHLKCLELDKILWNKYLQSGTGELMNDDNIRSIIISTSKLPVHHYWPLDIKLRMIKRGEVKVEDPNDIDNEACLDYVQRVLAKFNQQTEFYQNQFQSLRQHLGKRMTETIEDGITTYVRQYGIALYRIYTDKLIATVEFDYKDQLLVLQFQREYSTAPYQKKTFQELSQLKRTAEEAKFDIAILKQRITFNQLPRSFETFHIPAAIKFDHIHDKNIRQRLQEQCNKILQRTTSDMMLMAINIAETKFEECQAKFDRELAIVKKNQKAECFYDRLSDKQMDIMNRRFRLIDERLMHLYNLKLRFFEKAPTDMN